VENVGSTPTYSRILELLTVAVEGTTAHVLTRSLLTEGRELEPRTEQEAGKPGVIALKEPVSHVYLLTNCAHLPAASCWSIHHSLRYLLV
jgi:hypothetical protein